MKLAALTPLKLLLPTVPLITLAVIPLAMTAIDTTEGTTCCEIVAEQQFAKPPPQTFAKPPPSRPPPPPVVQPVRPRPHPPLSR